MLTEIERQLGSIPELTPEQKALLTTEGYLSYYFILCRKFQKIDAFSKIEDYFLRIFGFHKYSDYDSLRKAISRMDWDNVPPRRKK